LALAHPSVQHWVYMCPRHNPRHSGLALERGFTAILELPAGPLSIQNKLLECLSSKPKPEAHPPPKKTPNTLYPEFKTLVAEDNPVNQIVVKAALKKIGIIPDIANNGKEAVELIGNGEKQYSLILMDCEMPIMDGFTATRIIKGLILNKAPYICGLSAHANQESKDKGFDAGMDHYLTKPLNRDELYRLIESVNSGLLNDNDSALNTNQNPQ
ncbi:MAG: hypothetical protein COB04_13515, partial [Gammaproteobacteria bacterium]